MRSDAKYGTNDFVINSWTQGHSTKSSTGSLSTDGTVLFSYRLPIGYNIDNVLTALDYTSPDNFYSVTTSIHVGRAKAVADVVATPDSRTLDALATLLEQSLSKNMTCYCDDAPPIGTSLSSEDKRQHRYSHLLDHDRCSARWNANKWDAVPDNYDPNCSCCRDSQREAKASK
jgi:hypothetical protein